MDDRLNELSDFQIELLQSDACSQVFAVVSWGCAATAWLAKVLNSHPDIFCVHAGNQSWHVLGNVERLDGVPYMRIIAHQGSNYLAAGDVHGLTRHHVAELRQNLNGGFNAAVVVREPISRLRSQLALFAKYEKYAFWSIRYVDDVISRSGVTLPADNYNCRLFVHGVNMLNAILEEQGVGRVYRCEDLTQRAETLGDFVEELTCGKVSPSAGWLQSAIETPRANRHADPGAEHRFADWQVDVIRKVVDPRSWEIYQKLGYPPWERVIESFCGTAAGLT